MQIKKLLGTTRQRVVLILLVAVLAVAAGILWLRPSEQAQRTEAARQALAEGKAAYRNKDNFTALQALHKAMDDTRDGLNDTIFFEASVYLALLYERAGQSEEARALLQPLRFMEVDSVLTSVFYLRAASYHAAKLDRDYRRAERLIEQDIELSRRAFPEDKSILYLDRANLCELYYMMGDSARARREVLALEGGAPLERYGDLYLSEVYYVHGLLLRDEGNLDEAYRYAGLGAECARKYGYSDNEKLNLRLRCDIDSVRCDLRAYLQNRARLDTLNDQLRTAQLKERTALLREQNKLEIISRDNERRQIINLLLLVIFAVSVGFLVYILRSIRKKALVRQRMAELEHEKLDSEIQRNRLENELLKLKQSRMTEELDRAYRDNVNMTSMLAQQEEGKENGESLRSMEKNLLLHHADYMHRLQTAFPQLTDNDLRVLGFMYMGYSSKVIAAALNIAPGSLTTTRYRLKKKLGLAGSDDLKTFVDNF